MGMKEGGGVNGIGIDVMWKEGDGGTEKAKAQMKNQMSLQFTNSLG